MYIFNFCVLYTILCGVFITNSTSANSFISSHISKSIFKSSKNGKPKLEKKFHAGFRDYYKENASGHDTIELKKGEKLALRDEAREMFYHAYNAYMENAYPADELMPLSCKGRWRDSEYCRGDIDDTLGNFSLTLVDSLDTLVVVGDIEEFERALKLVIHDVSFDSDIVVSVFETNIRMVGGLLSGHILAEHLNQMYGAVPWYRGELLSMAKDLAIRLLPAFNTSTGIPHARINLKHGMNSHALQNSRDTCTACAGTIILEFAALSRLSGEPIFEEKAKIALDYLWSQRHRGSDLVGTVLNVHSGDWVRRDSGVGAGIDSYYEYLLKAYVLFGDDAYLNRFNKHYSAIMKYISQGPMLLDVHMHRPHTTSRNFMDAFLAFWPGVQVLKGDIKPAIETHEMLYQVIQRHNFLPEAFTTDFQVHWGQHPLRPEFVESTFLLYQATKDHHYLRVGEQVLRSLQKHAWVPCGYAAVKDVRTGGHEDRMDSFVLAETFKYLYLLFAEPADLLIDVDQFILTTEGHFLPLTLARLSNLTAVPLRDNMEPVEVDADIEYARSCPNAHYLFPGQHKFAEAIRRPLKNYVNNICPNSSSVNRKLRASEFQANNKQHLDLLKDLGITIIALSDGRVQLLHSSSNALSNVDAQEGLMFMQEMIELSKLQQDQPENPPRSVSFISPKEGFTNIMAGPAQFGLELKEDIKVKGPVILASPFKACTEFENAGQIKSHIVIMERGDCMFIDKARKIENYGAIGGIVVDNGKDTSIDSSPMFAMSGDGKNDVTIPLVFLFSKDAQKLLDVFDEAISIEVTLSDFIGVDSGIGEVQEITVQEVLDKLSSIDSANVEETREQLFRVLSNRKHSKQEYFKGKIAENDDLLMVDRYKVGSKGEYLDHSSVLKNIVSEFMESKSPEDLLRKVLGYIILRRKESPTIDDDQLLQELKVALQNSLKKASSLLLQVSNLHGPTYVKILLSAGPLAIQYKELLEKFIKAVPLLLQQSEFHDNLTEVITPKDSEMSSLHTVPITEPPVDDLISKKKCVSKDTATEQAKDEL